MRKLYLSYYLSKLHYVFFWELEKVECQSLEHRSELKNHWERVSAFARCQILRSSALSLILSLMVNFSWTTFTIMLLSSQIVCSLLGTATPGSGQNACVNSPSIEHLVCRPLCLMELPPQGCAQYFYSLVLPPPEWRMWARHKSPSTITFRISRFET